MRRMISVSATGLLVVLLLTIIPVPTATATPGIWISSRPIETSAGYPWDPDVAIDSRGNALATWHTRDSATGHHIVMASRYELGLGWTEPQPIGMMAAPWQGGQPQVATNSRGVSVVVWHDRSEVWANYFIPGFGWGSPVPLWGDGVDRPWSYGELRISAAPTGQFVVVWFGRHSEDNGAGIWASSFLPGVGWAQPDLMRTTRSRHPDVDPTMIALDGNGNAFVVWAQDGGLGISRFVPGTGWDAPAFLPTVGGRLDLAVSPSGDAWVVYQGEGAWAASFNPSMGWSAPTEVASGGSNPRVAVNDKGVAMVVFCNVADGRIRIKHYVSGVGWGDAASLETNIPGGAYWADCRPTLGFHGSGHGIVVWEERAEEYNRTLHASRLVPGGGQSAQITLSEPHQGAYRFRLGYAPPEIAVSASGSIALVWAGTMWSDGEWTDGLWSSLFVPVPELDVTPPILTITSPKDGATTSSPSVTVAGWTEPSVNLLVNGLRVGVAPEGSFSFPLALSEGTNTITATATDASGNSVSTTVRATYVNPLPGLDEQLQGTNDALGNALEALDASDAKVLLLLILQVGFAVSTAVILMLFWIQRRGGPGGGRSNPGKPRSPTSPDRRPGRVTRPKRPQARSGNTSIAGQYLPWPEGPPIGSPLYITAKERVMLHLLEHVKHERTREVPAEMTQTGIASAAGFDRRHFAQYIRPLLREGLVREEIAYVRGGLQRRKVYSLTEIGVRMAFGVRDRVRYVVIHIDNGSRLHKAPISEVLAKSPRSSTLLHIIREAIEAGFVDMRS